MLHVTIHVISFLRRTESIGPDTFLPHHVSITTFSGSPDGISGEIKDQKLAPDSHSQPDELKPVAPRHLT